jgi:hypothetical protein
MNELDDRAIPRTERGAQALVTLGNARQGVEQRIVGHGWSNAQGAFHDIVGDAAQRRSVETTLKEGRRVSRRHATSSGR